MEGQGRGGAPPRPGARGAGTCNVNMRYEPLSGCRKMGLESRNIRSPMTGPARGPHNPVRVSRCESSLIMDQNDKNKIRILLLFVKYGS